MEIVWSETVLETFLRVIDYLFDNWSKIEINKFDEDVDSLLEKNSNPQLIMSKIKIKWIQKMHN